jgi:poly(A) polymerase
MFQRSFRLEAGFQRRGRLLLMKLKGTAMDAFFPLQAARLCAEHDLELEAQTLQVLRGIDSAQPLESRTEFERLMRAKFAARGVHALDRLGWLQTHIPELEVARELQPFGFHHLNVLEHSIEALRVLTELWPTANLETRLATLLHDVGKPAARVWDEVRGHWSYFGHDDAGAQLCKPVLERFGFEAALIERVSLLVARHMIRLPGDNTQAARFVRRQRALLPDLLEVMLSDREAARGASSSEEARHAYKIGFDRVLEAMKSHDAVKPLVTGRDVMSWLGFAPGKEIGQALEFIAELQESGDVRDASEARAALVEWARVRGLRRYES